MRRCLFAVLVLSGIAALFTADLMAQEQQKEKNAGIQWLATWTSALQEAERRGRPILLVSAAPHCAGVSGMW